MIDPARQAAFLSPSPVPSPGQAHSAPHKPVLRMIHNDRMGGSIPAWVRPASAREDTLAQLARAEQGELNFNAALDDAALSYRAEIATGGGNINDQPFGFGDLIDIVNPLQHIPLVGTLYRHITGDQIRPSSSVIGGAIFGGALGAAGSLANVIIKEESGRDLGEHAIHLARAESGTGPRPAKSFPATATATEEPPLQRLATAGQPPQLPGSALSFLDMAYRAPMAPITETPPAPKNHNPARIAAIYRFND